jgi:hypothetical protein
VSDIRPHWYTHHEQQAAWPIFTLLRWQTMIIASSCREKDPESAERRFSMEAQELMTSVNADRQA